MIAYDRVRYINMRYEARCEVPPGVPVCQPSPSDLAAEPIETQHPEIARGDEAIAANRLSKCDTWTFDTSCVAGKISPPS